MGETNTIRQDNISSYTDKELLEEYRRAQEVVGDCQIPKPDQRELQYILMLVEEERRI